MDKKTVSDAVNFLGNALKDEGINIDRIILFGSYADGDAKEESDIDIIVISDDFENKDIFERAYLTKEAEIKTIKKYMVPLDIITLTPKEYKREHSIAALYSQNGEVFFAA